MRQILLFFLLSTFFSCEQKLTRPFTFKEIGWTIDLPEGFEVDDSASAAAKMAASKKSMEAINVNMVALETKHLIVAKKNVSNYFICSLTPFDESEYGSWLNATQKIRDISFESQSKKSPLAQFDSLTSLITIDTLSFSKFLITIKENNQLVYHSVMLSKLYKGYDLKISYGCSDNDVAKEIKEMLRRSKFSNL